MNNHQPPTFFAALKWAEQQMRSQHLDYNAPHFLLQMKYGWDDTHFLLHQREQMSEQAWNWFQQAVVRLNNNEPAQYIVGKAPFYGRTFQVNSHVLIPEPETADLVEWVLDQKDDRPLQVLDLGTGSGVIGITLALERPQWQVTLSDISNTALDVAKFNAQRLSAQVELVQSDLFDGLVNRRFDLVVTNPPYVDRADQGLMDPAVVKYEPALALYADEHGLGFYQRLFEQIAGHLTPKGELFGETGFDQEKRIQALFHRLNPGAKIVPRHDVANKMRMIHGWDFLNTGGNQKK
ncbi:N5-glutamine S-adenosyl-L-methionine-dependent methyltransferase [Limosilactobacillus frumenti DSM 13145]|uniref:Release factor glutamine methyltransferase n=1 Tax=Limosilactobacillus frumenti DSM 13145 TaxID=1423746 RepID=A0A0R1PIC9_9LACO|nr:peptide chain release factor N(5)-glutamine methyltransferase [Limosilactobacillus frumenti]KRL28651.1 N5-glutamine S-adenosyl-L-methionine-dependent methyltransferase [Limosilactobacillus frumenti DSM 13145]MBA2914131.1 peptide chain release factor N(5)-glutamine methyltransferase [Limosilactobacillus frumenti]QFG72282.1 peptide chain release factor N(5)-glutamine methyltransferase [Limosilactobacillus frumenti]